MPEVLVEFDTAVRDAAGNTWSPRACARLADDGLWEGWLEFIATDPSLPPVRTGRETQQHGRDGVAYWAQGLTQIYLEGALKRALAKPPTFVRRAEIHTEPVFDGPDPTRVRPVIVADRRPVLDPFDVYRQRPDLLASELSALDTARLRDIAVAYGIASVGDANAATSAALTAMILAAVRPPAARPRTNGETRADNPS